MKRFIYRSLSPFHHTHSLRMLQRLPRLLAQSGFLFGSRCASIIERRYREREGCRKCMLFKSWCLEDASESLFSARAQRKMSHFCQEAVNPVIRFIFSAINPREIEHAPQTHARGALIFLRDESSSVRIESSACEGLLLYSDRRVLLLQLEEKYSFRSYFPMRV